MFQLRLNLPLQVFHLFFKLVVVFGDESKQFTFIEFVFVPFLIRLIDSFAFFEFSLKFFFELFTFKLILVFFLC